MAAVGWEEEAATGWGAAAGAYLSAHMGSMDPPVCAFQICEFSRFALLCTAIFLPLLRDFQ